MNNEQLENRTAQKLPEGLSEALSVRSNRLSYSRLKHLFFVVNTYAGRCVGVAGDGNNGSYEWFVWDHEKKELQTSDCGFGATSVALREVLNQEEA